MILVSCLALAAIVAAAGTYVLLRTKGSPRQTATAYLDAWEKNDYAAMSALVAAPPADLATRLGSMRTNLGVTKAGFRLGTVRESRAPFTAALTLKGVGAWTYQGALNLTKRDRKWMVAWSPAAIHPQLKEGQRLALRATWPKRGAITAANGSRIDVPGVSGSVQQLAGLTGPATAADLKRLGSPYKKGDIVGHGGIQQQMEERLAGTPTTSVQIVDQSKRPVGTLHTIAGKRAAAVRTSLDPAVQSAAAQAIISQRKPAALVAMRPSTGEILAAANQPGGFNRALQGHYPPGSTFKVVTAAALLADGLTPQDKVECAKTTSIGGHKIRNFEDEEFGSIDFHTAFAKSCNTAFVTQTTQRLSHEQLATAARQFGLNTSVNPGVSASRSNFPTPRDPLEFAMESFGQARVSVTPLTMAGVAAAVQAGGWRPPRLVVSPAVSRQAKATSLDAGVAANLRSMMAAVVTSGTAASAKLPAGTAGKTGTAEYGTGDKLPTHAWFIGFRNDLAFAVVVEGGGTGGEVAAPLAARFLGAL
jgi:cell division protein FtsI/penicillin-binding protein 2